MISLIALVIAALTFAVLLAMIKAGNLTRNGLVGVRTSATMESDAAWQAGHRAAVPALSLGLMIFIVGTVAVLLTYHLYGDDMASLAGILALLAGVLPVLIATFTSVKRAAQRAHNEL